MVVILGGQFLVETLVGKFFWKFSPGGWAGGSQIPQPPSVKYIHVEYIRSLGTIWEFYG